MRREPPGQARRAHLARGIHPEPPAADQEPEEAPEGRQAPGDRGAGEPPIVKVREVSPHHSRIRVHERPEPAPPEESDAVVEVGPVAPDRVRRGSALGREVLEERGHRRPAWLSAGRLHAISASRR